MRYYSDIYPRWFYGLSTVFALPGTYNKDVCDVYSIKNQRTLINIKKYVKYIIIIIEEYDYG